MIKQISRPKIKLKKIEFDYNPKSNKEGVDINAQDTGKYPFVILKGQIIEATNILNLVLRNDKFIPTLELSFKDPTNQFIDPLFPLDDEIISIFIRSQSQSFMPVRMDFKVLVFNPVKNTKGVVSNVIFNITAVLNINYLFYKDSKAYKGTSFKVLKEVANNAQLGFVTNVDDTHDEMTWVVVNEMYTDFIADVIRLSYNHDSGFMWAFIDFYYNLNYVDVELELKEDTSKNVTTMINPDGSEDIIPLVLSNHPDKDQTNMYINTYNLESSSTEVNLTIGYKFNVRYYDVLAETFNIKLLDSISDAGVDENLIVMKGQVWDYKDLFENAQNDSWYGKLDTDNVHPNYIKALVQNHNNLDFLQKVKMVISLRNTNFTLYRFQPIRVEIYEMSDPMREKDISQENVYNKDVDLKKVDSNKINHRLSGDWLITGISYTFSQKNGIVQEVTLIKRELTAFYEK